MAVDRIPFDMSDPNTRDRVRQHIDQLCHRTARTIEALHYLKRGDRYLCLDVNIEVDSETILDSAVILFLSRRGALEVLPASPLPLWELMLRSPWKYQRKIVFAAGRNYHLVVSTCEAPCQP